MAVRLRGKLITFEGSEGSGKSTQIELIRRYLGARKRPVFFVREPGGVKISEPAADLAVLLAIKRSKKSSQNKGEKRDKSDYHK